jgi:hypothetical protein
LISRRISSAYGWRMARAPIQVGSADSRQGSGSRAAQTLHESTF